MNNAPLVAIATYNEIENLPKLIEQVFVHLPAAHILVVDDESPDGTGRWCAEHALAEPRLKCLLRPGKLGLGTAHVAAMRYALEHHYDTLITMDADFSHPPQHLEQLCAGTQAVDVVIGSRYVSGGSIRGWPWRRHVMSRLVNRYARLWLRLPCRDCSGAFRAYRTRALRSVSLDTVESRGYAFFEEILWRLRRKEATIQETPIEFVERELGRSKINLREAWTAVCLIFRWGWQERFQSSSSRKFAKTV